MKKHSSMILVFFVFLFLFSACHTEITQQSNLAKPTNTPVESTSTPLPTFTLTMTPSPTTRPTSTITFTPTSTATLTPMPGYLEFFQNFPVIEVDKIQTATQSIAGNCIKDDYLIPEKTPIIYSSAFQEEDDLEPATDEEILDFINTYGVEPLVGKNAATGRDDYPDPVLAYQDFTNDGIPEVILQQHGYLYIFGCVGEAYQLLFSVHPDMNYASPRIIAIEDLNLNGIPEIYMRTSTLTQGGEIYNGIEWDGSQFIWLLPDAGGGYYGQEYGINVFPGYLTFEDIDQDGMDDVVGVAEIPIWELYPSGLPWRIAKKVYKWNGVDFSFYREILDTPEFRFQAVQDGDRAVLAGEYNRALVFYKQAISSQQLKWFTEERHDYLQHEWSNRYDSTPRQLSTPEADPLEYDYLAAYAYFKTMAIYAEMGNMIDARNTLDTLNNLYPEEKPGSIYTQMAQEFWVGYVSTRSMTLSCSRVLEFAEQNWTEVTRYLGNTNEGNHSYFGWQSLNYSKASYMLCPFKDQATILHH